MDNELTDRNRLVEGYFAHVEAQKRGEKEDPHFWAVEAMWALIDRDEDESWTVLLEMLRRAEGEHMIASIAAGPLEDFIVRYGETFLPRIESEARTNSKFRRALVGVWGESRMSEELVLRLRSLVEREPPL